MRSRTKTPAFDLRGFRADMGLTQRQMAESLGVVRSAYQCWETTSAPAWIRLACRGFAVSRVLGLMQKPYTGADLACARSLLGLTQPELAQGLFASKSSLSRWENGEPPAWVGFAMVALTYELSTRW